MNDASPATQPRPPGPVPESPRPGNGRGRLFQIAVVLLIVFGLLLLLRLVPNLLHGSALKKDARRQENATPTVNVVTAQAPPPFDVLTLPGNVQAVEQTSITARASGYVRRWLADIGDHVRKGQALALIDTPELNAQTAQARAQLNASQAALGQARANLATQQANLAQAEAALSRSQATLQQARTDRARAQASLAQAQEATAQQRAQLVQAQSGLDLARVTAIRYRNLLADGAIDQQTTDQAVAAYQNNAANVEALRAAVRAGEANAQAFAEGVRSASANVQANVDAVRSSRAGVKAAAANVDSYRANIVAAQANVRSSRANLARTQALQGFQKVTAPFAGVITARNVDTGALISASGSVSGSGADSASVGSGDAGITALGGAAGGSASGSGSAPGGGAGGGTPTSLFSLAQTDALRIYLSVPQTYAGSVGAGQTAQVLVGDLPNQSFLGRVDRTASALDATTRTLVTEVRVANRHNLLRPGMFAQVRIRVPHPPGVVLIPDSALLTNASGTQALLVTSDNKLHYQPVTTGRDFGQVIEILAGVKPQQKVVSNPNDDLKEGEKVKPISAPPSTQGG